MKLIPHKKIPVSEPFLGKEERSSVLKAINDGYISGTSGEFIGTFENDFARYCGCRYGISTTSGTTALHLALAALGIGPGDEVIVPAFTNMAAFFAVHYVGAKPIAVDIESDTCNINSTLITAKLNKSTKAIIAVHVYGHPVDMDPIMLIAKKYNLFVIEDAAEAHGSKYNGKKVGSLGHIGCFSFYANKMVTTGEGGMIVTNNKKLAEKVKEIGSMSYGKKNRFEHTHVGFSYRMSNVLAAIGCAQLEKIDKIIEKKRTIADMYTRELSGIKGLQLPVEKNYARNVFCMYHLVLTDHLDGRRKQITENLSKLGIETREAFTPYHDQKILIQKGLVSTGDCSVASRVGRNGFYIPSYMGLSKIDQSYIVEKIKLAISNVKR